MKPSEAAEIIKSSVTMLDVLQRYGIAPKYGNRISCPLHGGKDNNFRVKEKTFNCFVCHESGDVIDFVAKYDGVTFKEAVKELGEMFHLDVERPDPKLSAEIRKKQAERVARKTRYEQLSEEYRRVTTIILERNPTDSEQEFDDEWCDAIKRVTFLEHELMEGDSVGV